jgi:type IV secretory pathway TrbL component
VKLLALWVAAAFLSLALVSSSAPGYAQSSVGGKASKGKSSGNASTGNSSGKATKTGPTSRKR